MMVSTSTLNHVESRLPQKSSKRYVVIARCCRMDALKKFDLKHWWNLVAAAGAVIAAAFFAAQLTHGFLLGLGLLLFGAGERVNHPRRNEIARGEIVGSSITTESNPWKPNLTGLSLDAFGIVLFAFSLFLAVAAP
jgi:hypothetical protein